VTGRVALVLALWLGGLAGLLVPLAVRAQASRAGALELTMPSVVMVLAVDVRSGELEPMATGSGTIVSADGAVLTNHHVLYDARDTRLHDLFLIGRFRAEHREPELVCAGTPAQGELAPDLDLALIRCDTDLHGQLYWPESWPQVPLGDSLGVVPGEQVWILGYPNTGRGTIRVSAGLVSGWTGEEGGTASRAFMRTNATVSAGNSGGAAVDRTGRLIGVPTAFRVVTAEGGETVTATGKIGLIRPIEAARALLSVLPGRASLAAVEPGRPLVPGEAGAMITGRVVEADSLRPVPGALVLALPAGARTRALDRESGAGRAALAWATTDATGAYQLEPALPRGAVYSLAVNARGYWPGVEVDAVKIPDRGVHPVQPAPRLDLVRAGLP
jgi:S1-C subfamily serine protease